MINDRSVIDFAESGANLYPHLKVTAEEFPRLLATRRFEDDDAEYFGAFLPKTGVRILMDFVNRVFRLRSCDIEIDGNFPVPCTQFYRKRCLAPCVENLCSRENYAEMVRLAKLFLSNQPGLFVSELQRRITTQAEALEFETAARWRDILVEIENYWKNPRSSVWLDDCVDTYAADESMAGQYVYLATQRGRKILGRKVFHVSKGGGMSNDEALKRIIDSFYRFHLPKEIRVSEDFEGRRELAEKLSNKFGRTVKIVVAFPQNQRITSVRALTSAQSENDLDSIKPMASAKVIGFELMRTFELREPPKRIEAYDVAHISGRSFVAASAVWENGKFITAEYSFAVSDQSSELSALAEYVKGRLAKPDDPRPILFLIDGGRAHLNTVIKAVHKNIGVDTPLIGAVKPAGRHSAISHFLPAVGDKIMFNPDSAAHWMLQLLRDAAHDLANQVHRDLRDMIHNYELAALLPSLTEAARRQFVARVGSLRKIGDLELKEVEKFADSKTARAIVADLEKTRLRGSETVIPFIVPIRFVAENGDADDLRPIDSK